ncbi:MAG: hypothetical protein WAN86_17475 [Hyphomicrobiaceae bacterium]
MSDENLIILDDRRPALLTLDAVVWAFLTTAIQASRKVGVSEQEVAAMMERYASLILETDGPTNVEALTKREVSPARAREALYEAFTDSQRQLAG